MIGSLPGLEDLERWLDLDGARVLLRADLNVPLRTLESDNGSHEGSGQELEVEDDFRIRAVLPTLNWLQERGARITVCSHLGRPGGRPDKRFEMAPVRKVLKRMAPSVELMENLRFDPGEEANSPQFVEKLVRGHNAYVNDAFGVSHRRHASIMGPPLILPSAAGRELEREVAVLSGLLDHPLRPFVAVVGGAKVGDKLGVLRSLSRLVDTLVIGGGMAFTFLAALGHEVGDSLVEQDRIADCQELIRSGKRVVIPLDVVALDPQGRVGPDGDGTGKVIVVGRDIPPGWRGLDIGPQSASQVQAEISRAATVFWNGPMGVFEDDRFAGGTAATAAAVGSTKAFTVVGGGDTASALERFGVVDRIDFISTGGGASLCMLEHGDLPGLEALRESARRMRGSIHECTIEKALPVERVAAVAHTSKNVPAGKRKNLGAKRGG